MRLNESYGDLLLAVKHIIALLLCLLRCSFCVPIIVRATLNQPNQHMARNLERERPALASA
jgi:hypothetical protein